MLKLSKPTAALLALLLSTWPCAAEPVMKFPNQYAYFSAMMACGPKYFQCNYTSKTCMQGRVWGNSFVGVVLDEDRETILAHVLCFVGDHLSKPTCKSFDDGTFTDHAGTYPGGFTEDVPQAVIEKLKPRNCPYE